MDEGELAIDVDIGDKDVEFTGAAEEVPNSVATELGLELIIDVVS